MRLFFDLDLQKFVLGPNTTQVLTSIDQLRSPNASIEIQFFRGATAQELPAGATGIFEVKESGKYDANSIFRAGSWTKFFSGSDTYYLFILNLLTAGGDLLLGVDSPITITATNATDTFNATAHGLSNGNTVQFSTSGALPTGLLANHDYFIINAAADTFKVSLTSGGAAVNITTDGTGTNQVRRIDNDSTSVSLMAAMQYVAGGQTIESQKLTFNYTNDIVRDGDTSPVADPADVVIGFRAGKEAISSASEGASVVFDTPFAGSLTYVVTLGVGKPTAGGDNIIATLVEDSVSETGFDYELSNATPNANYKLNYLAVAI